jgi:hypothetical protein
MSSHERLDLVPQKTRDENQLVRIQWQDTIKYLGQHRASGDRNERFRLAPRLGSKPGTQPGHRQDDIHRTLNFANVKCNDWRSVAATS